MDGISRKEFLNRMGIMGASVALLGQNSFAISTKEVPVGNGVIIGPIREKETVFSYINRIKGKYDLTLYRQIIGAANAFKEGDLNLGVAAQDDISRQRARTLLSDTSIRELTKHAIYKDDLFTLIEQTTSSAEGIYSEKGIHSGEDIQDWTMGNLKDFILNEPESAIKKIMPALSSDCIGCLVKLMSNEELIQVGQKIFNPLPNSKIGSKGYLSARVQPNSPTDNEEDIVWQVFDAWSYAVGDLVLGTNPVSSEVESVAQIEKSLFDLLVTFGLENTMPNCVLSHIDIQAEVEKIQPGTTGIWFQSLGGTVAANHTFDVSIPKMKEHVSQRTGPYGLYAETGQGADYTNGHGEGFDMVLHESRKYGFLRALKLEASTKASSELPTSSEAPSTSSERSSEPLGSSEEPSGSSNTTSESLETSSQASLTGKSGDTPWFHVNDVAGFIGPEVFKTKEQLVRCCLEDTAMGKLHGLTIGLDICSTLHMDVSLEDLDWCIDQIMPANPAYLMALPTKNDPMLSYLTTSFSDHVRIREKFGYKINDAMWDFFKKLEIIDAQGRPTEHFGDPTWVYYKYRLAKGDTRSKTEIYTEGKSTIARIRDRGVPIAEGHGEHIWDLQPELELQVKSLYKDAKESLWTEMTEEFLGTIPASVPIVTQSKDRKDYVYHPESGEGLDENAITALQKLRGSWKNDIPDIQFIISDGLNPRALMDEGHLIPYLNQLRFTLADKGYTVSPKNVVIRHGRVRAGYACGEVLYGKQGADDQNKGIVHIIGERPGSGHHNFSAYLTAAPINFWSKTGLVDHNITKVVSGISDTSLTPERASEQTIAILDRLFTTI